VIAGLVNEKPVERDRSHFAEGVSHSGGGFFQIGKLTFDLSDTGRRASLTKKQIVASDPIEIRRDRHP
jgi:hypothetical protein